MAKLRSVIGSGFVGRIGNVVGVRGKGGEYVIRARAEEVKNPNTKRQQVSRGKMSLASKLAAVLDPAIKSGYANACAGTKMYARNMFVKDVIPVDNGVLQNNGVVIDWSPANMVVSRAMGIAVKPTIEQSEPAGGGIKISATNTSAVVLNPGESLGMVVALVNGDKNLLSSGAIVKQVIATEGATFSAAEMTDFQSPVFYCFYKVIPAAKNGVTATEEPWMYPSATSATTFLGM